MSNEFTLIGIPDLLRRLRYLRHNLSTPQLMGEIGLFLITKIQVRTAEGRDAEGAPFRPYSRQYRLFRESKGRSGSKVNLFFTGSMMSAMTYDVRGDDTVRLFFQNTSDPSGTKNPLKAAALNEDRRFFAINEEERLGALNLIEGHIRRLRRRR